MSDNSSNKRTLSDLLKHPLANVVIGFLLTGVLGTALTQYFITLRQKQTMQQELANTRKQAIADLSALNAEYLARAEMLLTAVDRGDKDSAIKLKEVFDDAAVRWQTDKAPTLMAARDVLPHEIYLQYRELLNDRFRNRFLLPFRNCVSGAVETLAENGNVSAVLEDCQAHAYLKQALSCSRTLLDMLYDLSGYTVEGRTEEALEANRESYRASAEQACSLPG